MRKLTQTPPSFPTFVQAYFVEYLTQQRALSPQTVAAYRDALVLFLEFAQSQLGKAPVAMTLGEITPELITAFLDYLEQQRHNCVRSRNARLAALRSFLKFAGRRDVASLQVVERALGIPVKRFERPLFSYLSPEEMFAVLDAPPATWIGQRDHLLFQLLYNTGARVSEITQIEVGDVVLEEHAACVHLHGKGRKQRSVPLWRSTVKTLRAWIKLNAPFDPGAPLLPNRNGNTMTRTNASLRLAAAVATATKVYPELANRSISPHTIRHYSHALTAGWRRHQRHRTLAGARKSRDDSPATGSLQPEAALSPEDAGAVVRPVWTKRSYSQLVSCVPAAQSRPPRRPSSRLRPGPTELIRREQRRDRADDRGQGPHQPRSGFGSSMGAGAGGGGSSFVVLHAETPSTIAIAKSARIDLLVLLIDRFLCWLE